MQNTLKQKLEQVASKQGIKSLEWLGGSLYVKFQGDLPLMKADKTRFGLRKIIKADNEDSGVNMYWLPEDEFVYDFVPAAAETYVTDMSETHIPQEVDVQLELESEMARGK